MYNDEGSLISTIPGEVQQGHHTGGVQAYDVNGNPITIFPEDNSAGEVQVYYSSAGEEVTDAKRMKTIIVF